MTLTTERQQFEEWFTNKYPRSYWGVEKTASGEYQGGLAAPLWEAWQESRGCMANREAQPVAWEMRYWSDGYNIWGDWERITEELHNRLSAEHATDNDYEFRVLYDAPPAVPDDYQHLKNVQELYHSQEERLFALAQRIKGVSFDKYSHTTAQAIDVLEREIFGDDGGACRAAMLSQPVSQDYKLVPVEPTSQVIAPFIKHCCENETWVRQAWREMLAAAPEGGK